MGEFALAIVGVALAWKGILDFGQLISKLADDDDRKRGGLALRLEISQMLLKDWGNHWGLDREDGRFHSLADQRKDLLIKIIFRLHDSRERAINRLRKRYHQNEEEKQPTQQVRGDRLSRMVESFLATAKKSRKRTLWLMGDSDMVETLVEETTQLHEDLDRLTYMSAKFLRTHLDDSSPSSPLEYKLATMEDNMKRHNSNPAGTMNYLNGPTKIPEDYTVDDQTRVCYATDPTVPSKYRERILQQINESLDYHGDSRVTETVTSWWNSPCSKLLLLELPDDTEDNTGTSTCVLMYYMVKCHRLIYTFDTLSQEEPFVQIIEMLKVLFQSLISLRGNRPLEDLSFPVSITAMET